jgi:histidinol-phosphate aminotransferase
MSKYWSDLVHRLTPYVPGEQPKLSRLIKLNTNENPYPPSPAVIEALQLELGDGLRLYPDPNSDRLKGAIAGLFGLDSSQVFVGNGSDEVLAHAFQALLKHDRPILFPDITYSFYPVYCGLYDIDYRTVPLDEDMAIRVGDYRAPNGGIVLPNPNAPTGRLLGLDAIGQLLAAHPDSVVAIDEAYIDFGGESAVALIQTLSKSRSLAGLRVGYALAQPHLIEALERVKGSFNSYPLDRLAAAGATAALQDRAYFEQTRNKVMDTREWLREALEQRGFQVIPSAANFLFARHPRHDAAELARFLRDRHIVVRHFRLPRIEQYLRITVGRDDECRALVDALDQL